MADLSSKKASQTVKIAGASSSGSESTFAGVTDNQDLQTADILNVNVAQGILNVGTGASVEVKVGATPLANRKSILLQAQGSNVTYGFSAGSQPFTLANGSLVTLTLGENISVWVRRTIGLGTVPVAIAEFA